MEINRVPDILAGRNKTVHIFRNDLRRQATTGIHGFGAGAIRNAAVPPSPEDITGLKITPQEVRVSANGLCLSTSHRRLLRRTRKRDKHVTGRNCVVANHSGRGFNGVPQLLAKFRFTLNQQIGCYRNIAFREIDLDSFQLT